MENMNQEIPRRRPVRRRKTKWQIFKEAYLPTVILGLTVILVIWFIIGGAIRRNSSKNETVESTPPSTEATNLASRYQEEADRLLARAEAAALEYDYESATNILSSFSGNMADFPDLKNAYEAYVEIINTMVVWDDPSKIPTLSFHVLIADSELAYKDSQYGSSYKKNFITTAQFQEMLEQLYANNCVLVDISDIYEEVYDESTGKNVYQAKALSLPAGKTPIMLVQTQVNYYTYMIDGRKDGLPDGFASKLLVDENGKFYNEMPLKDGTTATGDYDMVPILEKFIAQHVDFSYHGARAILAITGYDGIFGYRVNSTKLSDTELAAEQSQAAALTKALQEAGYRIACYTYDNMNYGSKAAADIQADLKSWDTVVKPWLNGSNVDILVYAKEGDIATTDETYAGSKYNVLYNAGYRFFMGVSAEGFSQIGQQYVRHNRLAVTGSYITEHADWYEGLFDLREVTE